MWEAIKALKPVATRAAGKALFVGQKYSPEVLTAVGIVGMATAGILAVRSTLKLEPVVEKHENEVMAVHSMRDLQGYTDQQFRRDLVKAHTKYAVDLTKLYGPPITLAVLSAVSIVGGQGILKKRNVALVAGYKAIEESYNRYRQNVVDEYGEEKDREFRLGLKETEVVDFETGEKTKQVTSDPSRHSMYARFFDESNKNWTKNPAGNLAFLRGQQHWANDRLHTWGWITLNDVYEALGFDKTPEGQIVGWAMGNGGDDVVDFGIYDYDSPAARDFVNGHERSVLLDFNVDGVMVDLIGRRTR